MRRPVARPRHVHPLGVAVLGPVVAGVRPGSGRGCADLPGLPRRGRRRPGCPAAHARRGRPRTGACRRAPRLVGRGRRRADDVRGAALLRRVHRAGLARARHGRGRVVGDPGGRRPIPPRRRDRRGVGRCRLGALVRLDGAGPGPQPAGRQPGRVRGLRPGHPRAPGRGCPRMAEPPRPGARQPVGLADRRRSPGARSGRHDRRGPLRPARPRPAACCHRRWPCAGRRAPKPCWAARWCRRPGWWVPPGWPGWPRSRRTPLPLLGVARQPSCGATRSTWSRHSPDWPRGATQSTTGSGPGVPPHRCVRPLEVSSATPRRAP